MLITGVASFIGSDRCERLLDDGDPISWLDRSAESYEALRELATRGPSGSSGGARRPSNWRAQIVQQNAIAPLALAEPPLAESLREWTAAWKRGEALAS